MKSKKKIDMKVKLKQREQIKWSPVIKEYSAFTYKKRVE